MTLESRGPQLVALPLPASRRQWPARREPLDLDEVRTGCLDGVTRTVREALMMTETDALLVLHDGRLIAEFERTPGDLGREHLVMSITKSVIGAVAGMLLADGTITEDLQVSAVLPELNGGYADTTVRDLLDMRTGVHYSESLDDSARGRVLADVMYHPKSDWHCRDSITGYLTSLTQRHPSGGHFEYKSTDTDTLGWLIERATGQSTITLISDLIFSHLDLQGRPAMVVDAMGEPAHSGGLLLNAFDLARLGQLLLDSGATSQRQIVPVRFIQDTLRGGADSVEAMRAGVQDLGLPTLDGSPTRASKAMYRNQFWVPKQGGNQLLCLGIHGQVLLIDLAARVVAVKLSWWPTQSDPTRFTDSLAALVAIITEVSDADPRLVPTVK